MRTKLETSKNIIRYNLEIAVLNESIRELSQMTVENLQPEELKGNSWEVPDKVVDKIYMLQSMIINLKGMIEDEIEGGGNDGTN